MPKPIEVKPLDHYRLWLKYSDGIEGVVDLSDLVGQGVFALWNDEQAFHQVHIAPSGALAWSEQIDLCPDALYLQLTGQTPEALFPALREWAPYARD